MKIALMLPPTPCRDWKLAVQMGVEQAVTKLPREWEVNYKPWEYLHLLQLKESFADSGLKLSVLEGDPFPMNRIKTGQEGRDKDIEQFCQLLYNMGEIGIPVYCYNFMVQQTHLKTKLRTSLTTRTRGGALTTSFDYDMVKNDPSMNNLKISAAELWDNFEYFLERVVPVAEEAGVKLALHPDDPPLPSVNGIARIFSSPQAFRKVIELVPATVNGITFCQGNFAAMGANLEETVRYFAARDKIFFVHFRDIVGNAEKFTEVFIDDGQTDMYQMMKLYNQLGIDGYLRPDHTPTMAGEDNDDPGYKTMGRLFSVGYIKGLMEGVKANDSES